MCEGSLLQCWKACIACEWSTRSPGTKRKRRDRREERHIPAMQPPMSFTTHSISTPMSPSHRKLVSCSDRGKKGRKKRRNHATRGKELKDLSYHRRDRLHPSVLLSAWYTTIQSAKSTPARLLGSSTSYCCAHVSGVSFLCLPGVLDIQPAPPAVAPAPEPLFTYALRHVEVVVL